LGQNFGAIFLPRAGQPTYGLTVDRDSLPTNDPMCIEEIPTNRLTPKFDTFLIDSLLLCKEIADQPSDINYADRRSIGDVELY
jgi:hypothetical protein